MSFVAAFAAFAVNVFVIAIEPAPYYYYVLPMLSLARGVFLCELPLLTNGVVSTHGRSDDCVRRSCLRTYSRLRATARARQFRYA